MSGPVIGSLVGVAMFVLLLFGIFIWCWAPRKVAMITNPEDRIEPLNATRTMVVTAFGVLGLLVGGVGTIGTLIYTADTANIAQKTLSFTRDGQITDRYRSAIDQLASTSVDVRLGGVYALQRVMRDSPQGDGPTVVQVLSAFVRGHANKEHPDTPPPVDVDAAVRVIATRYQPAPYFEIDLDGAHLDHLSIAGGDLQLADLSGTSLGGGDMRNARLANSDLGSADLSGADLTGADLSEIKADDGTDFTGATLTNANLSGACLVSANFSGRETALANASFGNSTLSNANFKGADLRKVKGLTSSQISLAVIDGSTLLPAGVGYQKGRASSQGCTP